MRYIRWEGEKISLGRVEVDFTPEWIPDPACPNSGKAARGETVAADDIQKIAVPRARIIVRGSDKVFEIRDLERIQRLRKMMKRREPVVLVGNTDRPSGSVS